ncbi:cholesteryl ester transfer protein isoform X1 [Latimeria chalumnae]|uniref:cholesteryl ester transfer protein isoform X1 n=1 Tax=Latimeria chalumnae TaxID=7897 RepID=UPI00313B832A
MDYSYRGKMYLMIIVVFVSGSFSCNFGPVPLKETGIACKLTKPAALVLNQQTTEVVQAAFKHASFPDVQEKKSMRFLGDITYGLKNLQIRNFSIENSEVDLKENDAIEISIQDVSVSFKGTLHYGYDTRLFKVNSSIDFEIESVTDLQINSKLICSDGRVAADTSDCYLSFHKLKLGLQGDKQLEWIKRLFTEFISFTLKFVIKSRVCKEINNVANLLAGFIQDQAEQVLTYGDISVDISLASLPVLKKNYIESHHKGFLLYKEHPGFINESIFSPTLLTNSRMLYFWFSNEVLNFLAVAAHLDERLVLKIGGEEVKEMLNVEESDAYRSNLYQVLSDVLQQDSVSKVWTTNPPVIVFNPEGTLVKACVAVEINVSSEDQGSSQLLYFEAEVDSIVQASYADKKLGLNASAKSIIIKEMKSTPGISLDEESVTPYLQNVISHTGILKIASRLEAALTSMMDSKGLNLFDIINPEIITKEGYVLIQLDFGFPHHLLTSFLKRVL